jgi:type II secretory pathway predicted ATPase ExeA
MSLKALLQHFGLHSPPFTRAVPAGGLLAHASFNEALTRLRYAAESRTPAMVTAEPGLGKSTLLAAFSEGLDAANTRLVYSALCSCGPFGLIGQLSMRYGIKCRRSQAQTAQAILDELSRSDKTEVLVLDEAHRLPPSSLDELRLISNTDFDRTPPFTLVLVGQPPLREHIADPSLASLAQRIPIRSSLAPLTDRETAEYVERRMRAVGAAKCPFRAPALDKLFEHSRGVPRQINSYATGALLAAATAGRKHVEPADVATAVFDTEQR